MTGLPRTLPHGVRRLFRLPPTRERLLRDMDEEVRAHLALRAEELQSLGLSPDDAEREALRRFGDSAEFRAYAERRATRQAWWIGARQWLAELGQELRFAGRQYHKAPGFTAVALLTLAIGIGANTAIFTVVHRLLIAPLPYPNGERIVFLRQTGSNGFRAGLVSLVQSDAPVNATGDLVRAWRERARTLETIAVAEPIYLSLLPNGEQDTLAHATMTPNYLALLGVRPALGRSFTADDTRRGAPKVAIIGYGWWQRAYGGNRDVLGTTIDYEGEPYTIVGVTPAGVSLLTASTSIDPLTSPPPDVWLPAGADAMQGRFPINAFGLLRPGVSPRDAERELQAIAGSVLEPARRDSVRARAMRAQDFLDTRVARAMDVLLVAVGALLLIACANVANLLLARAWTRRREFAVRMGLGAGRARLTRQTLIESVLLAVVAGALGVLLAWQGVRAIVALRPVSLDSLAQLQLEPAVLFWTAAIAVVTGILFGVAPASFAGTRSVGDLLRSESRTATGGLLSRRIRSAMIVGEIALSLVMLVSAGLLVRSFVALQRTPLGFDPHGLVSVDILFPPRTPAEARASISQAIVERLRALPGVRDAAIGMIPTAGYGGSGAMEAERGGTIQQLPLSAFTTTWISADYPRTAGIALLEGRVPASGGFDMSRAPSMGAMSDEVLVNRAVARRIAPDGHAVGARIRSIVPSTPMPMPARGSAAWSTVVGIVDDVRLPGLGGDMREYQVYSLPTRLAPTFVVRFATVPPNVESVLRNAIHEVNPQVVARRARVADDYVNEVVAPTRFAMALLGAFSVIALVLSGIGLYGVIAYSVTQRTREIGIRVAMGAPPSAVTALVVRDGVRLAIIGVVLGLVVAVAATRALGSMLYGVTPDDPLTFASITVVVAAIALAASWVPARRAVRIDPTEALRAE